VKKSLIVAGLSVLSLFNALTARADLGDTYAQSCAKFHGPGVVDKESKSIAWAPNETWVVVQWFQNNRCVCVVYRGVNGPMDDPILWQILSRNAPGTRAWTEYNDTLPHRAFHWGDDYQLIGTLSDGSRNLRVTTQTWLRQHKLWDDSIGSNGADSSVPPVQDTI